MTKSLHAWQQQWAVEKHGGSLGIYCTMAPNSRLRVLSHAGGKISIWSPPHDPAQPSCQLFACSTISPNAFHKPSLFARVSPLHIYWPLLIVLFSGICKPLKLKLESGSASALKHLSPSQLRKTKETAVVFPQLVLFSVIRTPTSSQTIAGTQRALTIYQYYKIESESGLPPLNSKYIWWYIEVYRASYALYHEN